MAEFIKVGNEITVKPKLEGLAYELIKGKVYDLKYNRMEGKSYLVENGDLIDNSVILLFIENDADKNNLYKTIDRLGCVCNFEKQKPAELVKRLKSICNMYKVNVDAVTLNYLIENC